MTRLLCLYPLTSVDIAHKHSRGARSALHWGAALGARELEKDTLKERWDSMLTSFLAREDARLCMSAVDWARFEHIGADEILNSLARLRTFNTSHSKAARQEALDVILACAQGGRGWRKIQRSRHHNWTWDRHSTPVAPDISLDRTVATDSHVIRKENPGELSETAKMLLYEWPLGSEVRDYSYKNPYDGLDLGMSHISASQPERSVRTVPPVSSQREVPLVGSQRETEPRSSQEDPFKGVQSQAVPGRFGQRAPPPKRRKRMGGF